MERASWDHYLAELIAEPATPPVMHQGPWLPAVLRCAQPPTVHFTCDGRTESFVIRDPTADRLVAELNARFEVAAHCLLPFTEVPDFYELSHGDSVPLEAKPDVWAGIYTKARASDVTSQIQVGSMLASSGRIAEGLEWYLKAARLGDRNAAHHCGVLYFGHPTHVPVSLGEAEHWLQFAADRGHVKAERTLTTLRARPEFIKWKLEGRGAS